MTSVEPRVRFENVLEAVVPVVRSRTVGTARHARRAALAALWWAVMSGALQLAGCAGQPQGHADLLDFLRDGSTTRVQVELRLGEPSAQFEASRVLAYRLAKDQGGYLLMRRREDWANVQYDLMLLFDADGVLQQHSLVEVHGS